MARPMAGSSLSLSSSAKNLSHRNQHITRCAPLSCIGRKDLCGAARKTTHTQLGGMLPWISLRNRRHGVVYASTDTEKEPKKEEVKKIEEGLKESGVTRESAREILKAWSEKVGHEISPEELRKILVGQSSRAVAFVLISTLLDAGAAYGAFVAGNFFGSATESYGVLAVIGQALAYAAAGYYVAGAAFDFFKLGAVIIAAINFNVNSASFLAALQDLAGNGGTGLNVADKAVEAVNSIKVLSALGTMSDMLKSDTKKENSSADMLTDLGAYLTLDKAQRQYGFEASDYGITDAEAAEIAVAFAKFDTNDDGVLSDDEFRRVCAKYCPNLSSEEVKAAMSFIDINKDGSIEFGEFCKFWLKEIKV